MLPRIFWIVSLSRLGVRRSTVGRDVAVTFVAAVLTFQLVGCASKSNRIECPVAAERLGPGALGETAQQISVTGEELGNGSENAIGSAIATLRRRHSGARADAITNDLVTAYCPSLNRRSDMDLVAKQMAMLDFSQRVQRIIGS